MISIQPFLNLLLKPDLFSLQDQRSLNGPYIRPSHICGTLRPTPYMPLPHAEAASLRSPRLCEAKIFLFSGSEHLITFILCLVLHEKCVKTPLRTIFGLVFADLSVMTASRCENIPGDYSRCRFEFYQASLLYPAKQFAGIGGIVKRICRTFSAWECGEEPQFPRVAHGALLSRTFSPLDFESCVLSRPPLP